MGNISSSAHEVHEAHRDAKGTAGGAWNGYGVTGCVGNFRARKGKVEILAFSHLSV